MRWALVVAAAEANSSQIQRHSAAATEVATKTKSNPFLDHVAILNAQAPWKEAGQELKKVVATVKTDHENQAKFQDNKEAYCESHIQTTEEQLRDAKRSSALLADDKLKYEADVEAQNGTVDGLETKMASLQSELAAAQEERKKVDEKSASLLLAAKQTLVTADQVEQQQQSLQGAKVDKQDVRSTLQTQITMLDSAHQQQAYLLSQFANDKREALHQTEQKLQEARTKLLEKETALAEVVRTLNDNKRTSTRDKAYLRSVKKVCELFEKHEKGLRRSRSRLVDLVTALLKQVQDKASDKGSKKMLLQDIHALAQPGAPTTFLQMRQTQAQSNDVFKMVKDKIQDMLQAMEEEMNKEKGKHEWCMEEMQHNDEERLGFRDKMAASTSQIQYIRDQQKSLDNAHAFAHEAKAANQKNVEDLRQERDKLKERFKNASEHLQHFLAVFGQVEDLAKKKKGSSGVAQISSYLGEAIAEATKLSDLVSNAESEMLHSTQKMQEKSAQAAEARSRDAQDVDLQRSELADSLVQTRTDLKMATKNFKKASEYTDTLKEDCGPGNNEGEAAKRRQEEIEALQDALKVLNGEMVG